jgi:putative MATE family efflux protein
MESASFLGEERISALLWRFSVPAIAGMLVTALYNVVDSIFVGQGVGEIALTAVTIAFPVMTFLMAIGMLVGVGAATMVSLRLGEKRRDDAEMILGNALTLMAVLIFVTTGMFLYFLDDFLIDFLGVAPEVFPYARDFISIILLGSVFMHVGFGLNNVIRAQGDPHTALKTQLIAAGVNILFNYLFVFVLPWGVKGAALATIMAQATAAVWVVYYFTYGPGVLRFHWHCLRLRPAIVKDIFRIGVAPFLMQVVASAVMVILNVRIQMFGGTSAVAAYGVINRVQMLLMMPIVGISQGAQPIIGYNYGARDFTRVLKTLKLAITSAVLVGCVGFCFAEFFPQEIIRIFNESEALVALGTPGMRIFLFMSPVVGFQIISANYFQATGKPLYSIAFSMLRQLIVLIPMIYILSGYFGLMGVWIASPISDTASSLLTGICLRHDIRREKLRMGKAAA